MGGQPKTPIVPSIVYGFHSLTNSSLLLVDNLKNQYVEPLLKAAVNCKIIRPSVHTDRFALVRYPTHIQLHDFYNGLIVLVAIEPYNSTWWPSSYFVGNPQTWCKGSAHAGREKTPLIPHRLNTYAPLRVFLYILNVARDRKGTLPFHLTGVRDTWKLHEQPTCRPTPRPYARSRTHPGIMATNAPRSREGKRKKD